MASAAREPVPGSVWLQLPRTSRAFAGGKGITRHYHLNLARSAVPTELNRIPDCQLGNTAVNWKQRTLRFLAPRSGD